MSDGNHVKNKKQEQKNNTPIGKKQKLFNFLTIILVVISLGMGGYNLNNLQSDNIEDNQFSSSSPLIDFGGLYGTHQCENGGFSVLIGNDLNSNVELDYEEIEAAKNICHGKQGDPGPMGNRGYWGYNGSDGENGSDGADGNSAFIQSKTGPIGTCSSAILIEMGNDSTSKEIESRLKLCLGEFYEGRLTDIESMLGDSFTTPCSNGIILNDFFIFSAVSNNNCMLFSAKDTTITQISNSTNFLPGFYLGFLLHENRVWFDANDGLTTQLWSTDGTDLVQETSLMQEVSSGDSLVSSGENLALLQDNGIRFLGNSSGFTSGSYSNLTSINGKFAYNSNSGIILDGVNIGGEIHSEMIFRDGLYYFIASSDSFGRELHLSNGYDLVRLTQIPNSLVGNKITPTFVNNAIIFDSNSLYAYGIANQTTYQLSTDILVHSSDYAFSEGKLWLSCSLANYGNEICIADENGVHMVEDLVAGIGSSNPKLITQHDGMVFAILVNSSGGESLYHVSEEGLSQVYVPNQDNLEVGDRGELWFGPNLVYLTADTLTHGTELFGWSHGQVSDDWIII